MTTSKPEHFTLQAIESLRPGQTAIIEITANSINFEPQEIVRFIVYSSSKKEQKLQLKYEGEWCFLLSFLPFFFRSDRAEILVVGRGEHMKRKGGKLFHPTTDKPIEWNETPKFLLRRRRLLAAHPPPTPNGKEVFLELKATETPAEKTQAEQDDLKDL